MHTPLCQLSGQMKLISGKPPHMHILGTCSTVVHTLALMWSPPAFAQHISTPQACLLPILRCGCHNLASQLCWHCTHHPSIPLHNKYHGQQDSLATQQCGHTVGVHFAARVGAIGCVCMELWPLQGCVQNSAKCAHPVLQVVHTLCKQFASKVSCHASANMHNTLGGSQGK